jgi:hypothetical protein
VINRLIVKALLATALVSGQQFQPVTNTTQVAEIVADSSVWKNQKLSGSLIYKGDCVSSGVAIRFPLQTHPSNNASALSSLKEILGDDPKMEVRQDHSGMIRMLETDVSQEILHIRIKHINFDDEKTSWNFYSGNRMLWPILEAPEVRSFMQLHNIHPVGWKPGTQFWEVSGAPYSAAIHVSGQMNNTTVSQALDRVAKTFPGLWVYRECNLMPGNYRLLSFDLLDDSVSGLWQQIKHY